MKSEKEIQQIINQAIEGSDIFLVDVQMTPNRISVFVDKHEGITIEECVKIHKYLVSELRDDPIFETHNFEVSSPGMTQPLKVVEQYKKRIGSELNVITSDGLKHTGVLVNATSKGIALKENEDKSETEESYLYTDIKQATLEF